MAFGQVSGPPASAKVLDQLSTLLEETGHGTFREARHRLGLTQRQAGGKFTVAEATALIEQLQEGETAENAEERQSMADLRAEARAVRQREEAVLGLPAELLATELERRGWTCIPPL